MNQKLLLVLFASTTLFLLVVLVSVLIYHSAEKSADTAASQKVTVIPVKSRKVTRKPNRGYVVISSSHLRGKGMDKDWGVKQFVDFDLMGRTRFESKIVKQTNDEIVEERKYLEAEYVLVVHDDGFELKHEWYMAHAALGTLITGGNPVAGSMGAAVWKALNDLSSKALKGRIISRRGEGLVVSGKRYRITYFSGSELEVARIDRWKDNAWVELAKPDVTGKSVDELARKEWVLVQGHHVFGDANVFQDSTTYDLPAAALTLVFDGRMDAIPTGNLKARLRGPAKHRGQKCEQITLTGRIEYRGRGILNEKHKGRIVSRFDVGQGKLYFDRLRSLLLHASLTGTGELLVRSEDHWLFEAAIKGRPTVTLVYDARPKKR